MGMEAMALDILFVMGEGRVMDGALFDTTEMSVPIIIRFNSPNSRVGCSPS